MDSIERINYIPDNDDEVRVRDMSGQPTFESILEEHLDRRTVLKGAAAALPVMAAPGVVAMTAGEAEAQAFNGALTFANVPENNLDQVTVPPGYKTDIIIKWGDPLFPGMPAFDPNNQSPADARRRFGFNVDMISLFPERFGAPATIGRLPYPSYIMATNHEYVTPATIFPNTTNATPLSQQQVETLLEYVGVAVTQIRLRNGSWSYDPASRYNRRITATTPITITGPAAGSPKMSTPADPSGRTVLGTYNNCAGGFTPWGTYLSAEENVNFLFDNPTGAANPNVQVDHDDMGARRGVVGSNYSRYFNRFNLSHPEGQNEFYRWGWVVEVDPYDPTSTPKKRTALGRFKHECATVTLTQDDQVVVYGGDDERFEYVYKFLSTGRFNRAEPRSAANMDLLDAGILYAARFNPDGTGQWLPLDLNHPTSGPLLRASRYPDGTPRFQTAADVVINARRAGDAVGATPMDRPEDVEAPQGDDFRGFGKVFIACTNNSNRTGASALTNSDSRRTGSGRETANAANPANPRLRNISGHIIEITEAGNNHASLTFTWRIFMLAGNPANPAGGLSAGSTNVRLNGVPTFTGDRWSCPDNIAFDKAGNIWIATDGSPSVFNQGDQVMVAPTNLPPGQPIPTLRFMVAPPGAEVCGPLLSPDNSTFFCALQHPGEDGARLFSNPQSVWPDNVLNVAPANRFPKPAVIAIRRTDGGRVGS